MVTDAADDKDSCFWSLCFWGSTAVLLILFSSLLKHFKGIIYYNNKESDENVSF